MGVPEVLQREVIVWDERYEFCLLIGDVQLKTTGWSPRDSEVSAFVLGV
jgi:hypothetical protein